MHTALLIFLAVLPVIVIIYYTLHIDKYEKEPPIPLAICFLLGMLSTIPILYIEKWIVTIGFDESGHWLETFFYAFIGIALVEEAVKFVIVMLYPFRRSFFDEPMDGIVYSVMVSLGFAVVENVIYATTFGLETTIVRACTAIPIHASLGVILGYYVGLAKFEPQYRIKLLLKGLLMVTVLHGLYDFFLIQNIYAGLMGLALVCLYYSLRDAKRFISLHQANSPFKPEDHEKIDSWV